MATSTKKRAVKKSTPAPEPEVDETELEETEDELEELEEDEAEVAPKKSSVQQVTFGVSDLAAYLTEKSGKKVTARELRTLIRKMARDGSGRVDREITPGNRTRYDWTGLKDPEVRAIIKAFNDGELEADKAEKLAALKARKANEPKKATAKKAAKKAKPAPVEVEEDDEDEELELDDED